MAHAFNNSDRPGPAIQDATIRVKNGPFLQDPIPVAVRDAAPNGLLVVTSRENGWLWSPSLRIDTELRRNSTVALLFALEGGDVMLYATVAWCEGGQAGLRAHLRSASSEDQDNYLRWIHGLAEAA